MAADLPQPHVPSLGSDNSIDLDELGSDSLVTYVNYPGIAEGDSFWPNWRGCGPLGDPDDYFNNLVTIQPGDLEPDGMPVYILNDRLVAVDQGWVFYSYQMDDPSAPDGRGEESKRRFFYVGKRPSGTVSLPPPQFNESHDLCVDLSLIGPAGATIVTPAYLAMSVGDTVTLTIQRYIDADLHFDDYVITKILSDDDIGQPLQWSVEKSQLEFFGLLVLSYRIDYATPTVPTTSAEQWLSIAAPQTPLLPSLAIKDFSGDMLDPEAHLNGITLNIPLYPGVLVGDDVVVYALGDTRVIKTLRVDSSTIDGELLEVKLEYEWLAANNGEQVSLMYQFARVGSAGTSTPLPLRLRRPSNLPRPIVEGATPDGDDKGYLNAERISSVVYVRIPDEAVIGNGDRVQMIWDGYGELGKYIADPTVGDSKRFQIPQRYVPANMGKRLDVFYEVTPQGEEAEPSRIFDLEIKDVASGWPILQIQLPPSPNNIVSLGTATSGVYFKLLSWRFMAEGQRVRMYVTGLLSDGVTLERYDLRTGDAEPVSEDEYYDGEVFANLPRDFLQRLKLNQFFDVTIETSFDEGFSYKQFPMITPQLVA